MSVNIRWIFLIKLTWLKMKTLLLLLKWHGEITSTNSSSPITEKFQSDATLYTPQSDQVGNLEICYVWPVPLCYQSIHSNLKEKRQILRDTVNHIQTIHKEKGDRRKKNRKGLLTKILNCLHMGKHILCHLRYMYQLHLN